MNYTIYNLNGYQIVRHLDDDVEVHTAQHQNVGIIAQGTRAAVEAAAMAAPKPIRCSFCNDDPTVRCFFCQPS
jgi:hypothetical protein